jgi:hypothetical protein
VRFVLAIVCFVLAALAIGLGVAERTVLAGPDHVSLSTTARQSATVVVIDGSALDAYPHTQTVQLSGSSKTFAAYGRTSDVLAWIGDTTYTEVSFDKATGTLVSQVHVGKATRVPSAVGSDLWLQQFTGTHATDFEVKIPATMSVIATSNGTLPAPSTVTLSWPVDNSVPWSGPVIFGGTITLLVGIVLLLWAFAHLRRARGPRRSSPRMPKLPRQPRYKPRRTPVAATKGRRSRRRFQALTPPVVLATLLLAGCSAAPAPSTSASPFSAKEAAATSSQLPAVTPGQLQEIVQRIAKTVASADAVGNSDLIGTRMEGAALDQRLANYTVRRANPSQPAALAIPSGQIVLDLPQASNTWPRTVFTVIQNKKQSSVAPIALMLVQDTPRSNYKVNYVMALQPNTKLPEVAPANVGATRFLPNVRLLKLQPGAIALAYGDILDRDIASPSYPLFQAKGDTFRTQVGIKAKQAAQAALPATAKLTFTNANGDGQVIALATNDSGAIVAVDLDEIETVVPVQAGAAVTAPVAIQALSGKATSTKGLIATYGDQLLFYVPAAGASGKIVLLGFSQGPISAQEVGQ